MDFTFDDMDDVERLLVGTAEEEEEEEEELPPRSFSISSFYDKAKELHAKQDLSDFVKFVLSGTLHGRQVIVDPILHRMVDDYSINVHRDYDSLLGLHSDICVLAALTLFPVPRFDDTLKENVHIEHTFERAGADPFTAPLHHVPNIPIGKWGDHTLLRVFIPTLYDPDEHKPFLNQYQLSQFYDLGFRPAVRQLSPSVASEWPASYANEMYRARNERGHLHFQTKTLAEGHAQDLAQEIRRQLSHRGLEGWATGLVVLHQIRGVKSSHPHEPTQASAEEAMEEFVRQHCLAKDMMRNGHWWVDVGVQIECAWGHSVAWRTSSHPHIVKAACRIPDPHASRITTPGSTEYTRDLTSHLPAVSGCRITPGISTRRSTDIRVAYIQMYGTDKSVTYQSQGMQPAKSMRYPAALNSSHQSYIEGLYNIDLEGINRNPALARLELRVEFSQGCQVLLDRDLGQPLLRRSLIAIPSVYFWGLRAYRADAVDLVLRWQNQGNVTLRAENRALLLTIGVTWLLNSIHMTMDKRNASRHLIRIILPQIERRQADRDVLALGTPRNAYHAPDVDHIQDEEEGNPDNCHDVPDCSLAPGYPFGMVFLCDFCVGGGCELPYFGGEVGRLPKAAFKFFLGFSLEDAYTQILKTSLSPPSNPSRTRNKAQSTMPCPFPGPNPSPFALEEAGYSLPPPAANGGPDLEVEPEPSADRLPINDAVNLIWRQFFVDLIQLSPNMFGSSAPSYCIIPPAERPSVNEATFQSRKVTDVFALFSWKRCTPAEWNSTFHHLFPLQIQPGAKQNYPSATYYIEWAKLRIRCSVDQGMFERIQEDLCTKFDSLSWMTFAQSDRMWITKKANGNWAQEGVPQGRSNGPRILIRGTNPHGQ